MNTEEKVQLLGGELVGVVQRVNDLIPLIGELYEQVGKLLNKDYGITFNENRFRNTRNEVTYLHNEVYELQKLLGLHGEEPKAHKEEKYGYH